MVTSIGWNIGGTVLCRMYVEIGCPLSNIAAKIQGGPPANNPSLHLGEGGTPQNCVFAVIGQSHWTPCRLGTPLSGAVSI